MTNIDVTKCEYYLPIDKCLVSSIISGFGTIREGAIICKCSTNTNCHCKQKQQSDEDVKQYSEWLDETREELRKSEQARLELAKELEQLKQRETCMEPRKDFKELLEEMHRPAVHMVLALKSLLKNQRREFETSAHYVVYVNSLKEEINKELSELLVQECKV